MSIPEQFRQHDAKHKAAVMHNTWGHLDAVPGSEHHGWFTFINGQYGNVCVLESDFHSLSGGPRFFADCNDFIFSKSLKSEPCAEIGLYKFVGKYKQFKNGKAKFFGKIHLIKMDR